MRVGTEVEAAHAVEEDERRERGGEGQEEGVGSYNVVERECGWVLDEIE